MPETNSQKDRLTPRQLVRLGSFWNAMAEAAYNTAETMNDDSMMSDTERTYLMGACATMSLLGQRISSYAQERECDIQRVRG